MRNFICAEHLPTNPDKSVNWHISSLTARACAIAHASSLHKGLSVVLCANNRSAQQLAQALACISTDESILFPHWGNLPYDSFSPHASIISNRIRALMAAVNNKPCILVASVDTLMLRLGPKQYFQSRCFSLYVGQKTPFAALRSHLLDAGYIKVNQVNDSGEFTLRGSLIDFFPMGSNNPIRVDFFDDEISSIRYFDAQSQKSLENVDQIDLMPVSEIPDDEETKSHFSKRWNARFSGVSRECAIYQDVRHGLRPGGIEYYLPLFFDTTETFFHYLPAQTLLLIESESHQASTQYTNEIHLRYNAIQDEIARPLLEPHEIFVRSEELFAQCKNFRRVWIECAKEPVRSRYIAWNFTELPNLHLDLHAHNPLVKLQNFASQSRFPIVLGCNSAGRMAIVADLLQNQAIPFVSCESWHDLTNVTKGLYLLPQPFADSCLLENTWALLSEDALYGEQVAPQISRAQTDNHAALIRNLVELDIDCFVVHNHYGVGRYKGLELVNIDTIASEFMALEYANDTRLLVPVTELSLISRYQGDISDNKGLDKLGTDAWDKKVAKAQKRARDSAAELLALYAKRAINQAGACQPPSTNFSRFCAEFNFVETPDQTLAIEAIIADMCNEKSMDRLVCGDVGFGKTEVAMRAAFLAAENTRQVAILCPTTLLAQQHYNTFVDRFGAWPIQIEVISRFLSAKETTKVCEQLAKGAIDIIIGTHALLTHKQHFANLGLVIIDEEHRFGVHQKEQLKELRTGVDILTLTATPIPRTLNFSLSGLRDLSIIATAPSNRLAIETLISKERDDIIREAVLRELLRGGQVFVVYNQVKTMHKFAERLANIVPEARIEIAHGQMHERDLERTMKRFYHQEYNVLVCSTIIENGIDIPSANTIVILRADKFGLAQLHQLRGRVGRSHHQAYAYLLVPDYITEDAKARLDAIASAKTLGAGFSLAMHDLEIRGAGEILGQEQSGDIAKIGFTLYVSMLERAIASLRSGEDLALSTKEHTCEIDIHCSAIIPHQWVPDVQTRLQLYKQIANTNTISELAMLRAELIDRFGKLPTEVDNLLQVTRLRHKAQRIGIQKINATPKKIRIIFTPKPRIHFEKLMALFQEQPQTYQLRVNDTLQITKSTESVIERIAIIDDVCSEISITENEKSLFI